jgi:hypothetical protein
MHSALAKKAAQNSSSDAAYGLAMSAPSAENYLKSLGPKPVWPKVPEASPIMTANDISEKYSKKSPYSDAQMAKDYQAHQNKLADREWDSLNSQLSTEALNTPTQFTAGQQSLEKFNQVSDPSNTAADFDTQAKSLGMGETTLDTAGLGTRDKWEIGLGAAQLGLGVWGAYNAAKGMRDTLKTSAQNRRINQEMWDSKKASKTALSQGLAAVRSTRQGA